MTLSGSKRPACSSTWEKSPGCKKSAVGKDCPYEAELNALLTGDEEIRKMNREFRGIDKATDVLSFPTALFLLHMVVAA